MCSFCPQCHVMFTQASCLISRQEKRAKDTCQLGFPIFLFFGFFLNKIFFPWGSSSHLPLISHSPDQDTWPFYLQEGLGRGVYSFGHIVPQTKSGLCYLGQNEGHVARQITMSPRKNTRKISGISSVRGTKGEPGLTEFGTEDQGSPFLMDGRGLPSSPCTSNLFSFLCWPASSVYILFLVDNNFCLPMDHTSCPTYECSAASVSQFQIQEDIRLDTFLSQAYKLLVIG